LLHSWASVFTADAGPATADIENELKLLMQNITLLKENAEDYLQEQEEKEEGKKP
jgi:hypothetical protein